MKKKIVTIAFLSSFVFSPCFTAMGAVGPQWAAVQIPLGGTIKTPPKGGTPPTGGGLQAPPKSFTTVRHHGKSFQVITKDGKRFIMKGGKLIPLEKRRAGGKAWKAGGGRPTDEGVVIQQKAL